MRKVAAGAAGMLLLLILAFGALFIAVSEPGSTRAHPAPLGGGVRQLDPPADLQPNETWLGDVNLTTSALVTPDGPLSDVHATASNVRAGSAGLMVGTLALDATLPFDVAATQIGEGITLTDAGGGLVGIERSADILGRNVRIAATGRVRAEGGDLVIEPESVDLGGPAVLDDLLGFAARKLVTIRHTIDGLPAGLRLTDVSVSAVGFAAHLDGTDVVLAEP